jgi:hypothetical protein
MCGVLCLLPVLFGSTAVYCSKCFLQVGVHSFLQSRVPCITAVLFGYAQGQESCDAGVSDVCRLLAAPEDLARLQQLRAEVRG